jgi:hypothetical protein
MKTHKHSLLALGMAAGLGLSLAMMPASAEEVIQPSPSAEAMAFDGIIVRPLSLAGSIVSTALFVVTLPFSVIGGNAEEAAHSMVAEPFGYTFARPLGDYEYEH